MFGLKYQPVAVEVSATAYDEIALAMVNSGVVVSMLAGGLDMRGIAIVRGPEPEHHVVEHRPISSAKVTRKNTAPGAI
ncbi:MAG: hypothetical protein NUV75_01935 [Gallionella sp.]|nr:hypothetical protein [Gallionella sp.]